MPASRKAQARADRDWEALKQRAAHRKAIESLEWGDTPITSRHLAAIGLFPRGSTPAEQRSTLRSIRNRKSKRG